MAESDIHGNFTGTLSAIKKKLELQVPVWNEEAAQRGEHRCSEHLTSRVKTECNMQDKLLRRGLEETTENALCRLTNAIDLWTVACFVNDIYHVKVKLAALPGVEIAEEKGYIQNVKPSDYRSLHLILRCETDASDFYGWVPGQSFAEMQICTIVMDSWVSPEHEMHYEWEDGNRVLIAAKSKHAADDLASCGLSIQTIRNMIREGEV